jgi:hypothetical protein
VSKKKILQIVTSAHRGTLEEQDDTVVWLTHAMQGAGAHLDVCLRGNAVGYAVKSQDASGLAFGAKCQTQPPRIADEIAKLIEKGTLVYVVHEDATERGLARDELLGGTRPLARADLPALFASYDHVWQW